jgi:predicted metal-binding protein
MSEELKADAKINEIIASYDIPEADYKWMPAKNIVVAQWVRMKCTFGCKSYGNCAICPPNVPTVTECKEFFGEYSKAIVFHFTLPSIDKKTHDKWVKGLSESLEKIEREVFLANFEKAFMFRADSCSICADCQPTRAKCNHPRRARPSIEAFAVDVYSTVRSVGYPISVVNEEATEVNRYGFLMIE